MQCTCKDGSSKRSFEKEILKAVLNGANMGDINHDKEFPVLFRPFVVAQVSQRLTKYFGTRLEQTSFNPPVNIQTGKGTNYHRTKYNTKYK